MLLGSHNIRKYASTYCRACGIHKDEKDIRGCWKGKGCVSDVYDNVELPYPDAKVAAALCGAGPCIYVTNPAAAACCCLGQPCNDACNPHADPRSLHDLWQEYEHGVGGRKAAWLSQF